MWVGGVQIKESRSKWTLLQSPPGVKSSGGYRAWLKNIKYWRKKLLRNEINFPEDNFSKSQSGSRESLDQVR